jgi:hypothetical protein
MSEDQIYSQLVRVFGDFLVPLRSGAPLDEEAFKAVLSTLRTLKSHLSDDAAVPKSIVRLLVDFHPQLMGIMQERNQQEMATLIDWSVDIVDHIDESLD